MRALARATAILFAGTWTTTAVGLARNKLLAVQVGPDGVGTLGLLLSTAATAATFIGLLSGPGLVRYTSRHRATDARGAIAAALKALLVLQVGGGVLVTGAAFLFRSQLASLLASGQPVAPLYAAAALATIPALTVVALVAAVLKGYRAMAALTTVNVTAALVSLAALALLATRWGLTGAVVHMFADSLILLAASLYMIRRVDPRLLHEVAAARFELQPLAELAAFGVGLQLAGMLVAASLLYGRALLVRTVGLADAGIFQAGLSFVASAMALRTAISTYSFSELSGIQDPVELCRCLDDTIRFSLVVTTPLVCGLVLFSPELVRLLLSRDFLPLVQFLPVLLLSVWLTSQGGLLSQAILARGRLAYSVGVEVLWCVAFVSLSTLLIPRLHLFGATAAYTIAYAAGLPVSYLVAHRTLGYRPSSRGITFGLLAIVAIGAVARATTLPLWSRILILSGLTALATLGLRPPERRGLFASIPRLRRAPTAHS